MISTIQKIEQRKEKLKGSIDWFLDYQTRHKEYVKEFGHQQHVYSQAQFDIFERCYYGTVNEVAFLESLLEDFKNN